jgi:hypothetical protein
VEIWYNWVFGWKFGVTQEDCKKDNWWFIVNSMGF